MSSQLRPIPIRHAQTPMLPQHIERFPSNVCGFDLTHSRRASSHSRNASDLSDDCQSSGSNERSGAGGSATTGLRCVATRPTPPAQHATSSAHATSRSRPSAHAWQRGASPKPATHQANSANPPDGATTTGDPEAPSTVGSDATGPWSQEPSTTTHAPRAQAGRPHRTMRRLTRTSSSPAVRTYLVATSVHNCLPGVLSPDGGFSGSSITRIMSGQTDNSPKWDRAP